jgi:hypothetical protein
LLTRGERVGQLPGSSVRTAAAVQIGQQPPESSQRPLASPPARTRPASQNNSVQLMAAGSTDRHDATAGALLGANGAESVLQYAEMIIW